MPTACITQTDCHVRLCSERLQIWARTDSGRDEVLREIPLRDLDRLILDESAQLSGGAMSALLRAEIPVAWLDWSGRFLGSAQPAQNAHGLARLEQYRRTADSRFALAVARKIVAAKIYNQRRVLQRLNLSREDQSEADAPVSAETREALDGMLRILNGIQGLDTIDRLRGGEGAASAQYFQAWARFLPEAFPFERRSTRPPLNPVNACISFAATILYNEMVSCIHARGLDPSLGLLHATENGRWSLALDLIEPFRAPVVEALTLDLFSRGILNSEHFAPENDGIYLTAEGRRKLLLQYERRMERQFMSESVGHRTTLRQELDQSAVRYKAALQNVDQFEPFLVN